jgi:negative regulator of sigma-B (phosphoserine phosphatase)
MEAVTQQQHILEWGTAALALDEGRESGDLCLVVPLAHGMLVAVVDGLGHGAIAASVARRATEILRRHAHEPLNALVGYCHAGLRHTRGAVMSLAFFHRFDGMMSWIGIGNVEGRLLRANANGDSNCEFLLLHSGTVGDRLPILQERRLKVGPGDTLIFATDGIRHDFTGSSRIDETPSQIAERILKRYITSSDDALVLVARTRVNAV